MATVGSNPTLSACFDRQPALGGFVSVSSYVITLALMLTWHEQNNLSRQESVNR